jgi:hypothetical protein
MILSAGWDNLAAALFMGKCELRPVVRAFF